MAITHYNTTTKADNIVGSGSFTFSHDSGNLGNRYLLVNTEGDDTVSINVTGVKYNGVAMTVQVDYSSGGGIFGALCPTIKVWGLANPASGTNTVEVTYTGRSSGAIASTYNNASLPNIINYYTANTSAGPTTTFSPSLSLTKSGSWLLGFPSNAKTGDTISASTNTTSRGVLQDVGQWGRMNSDNNGGGATTLNYTSPTSNLWSGVLIELEETSFIPQVIFM
jgi:hypothetical protein